MHVCVDKTGKRRRALQIDETRIARARASFIERAREQDASRAYAHRLNPRTRRDSCMDRPAMEDNITPIRGAMRAACRQSRQGEPRELAPGCAC